MGILNLGLMKSPLNWLIILLMVVTGVLMMELIRDSVIRISGLSATDKE